MASAEYEAPGLEIKTEIDVSPVKLEPAEYTTDSGTISEETNLKTGGSPLNELQAEHFAFQWTPHGFRCPKCPFITKIEGFLWKHIEKKHPDVNFKREKVLKCAHCSFKTVHKSHFAHHVLKRHTQDFECEYCSFKAQTEKRLEKHVEIHNCFKCHQCEYQAKSKVSLKSHINTKHKADKRWFQCEQCDYGSVKETELKIHVKKRHSEGVNEAEYECDDCDFKTKYKSGLSRHIYYKHKTFDEVKWIECEKCPYKAKSETFLKVHVINEHSNVETEVETA